MSDQPPLSRRAARAAAQGGSRSKAPTTARAVSDAGDAEAPTKGGILGAIRRHPTSWLVSTIVVVFVALGTGAVFTGLAVASGRETPLAPIVDEEVPPRPLPDEVSAVSALRTCSVDDLASSGRLERVYATAVLWDGSEPETLLTRRAETPVRTGGLMRLVSAASSLTLLGPDYRITTSVVEGSIPGSVVLVGRGDPTLSASGSSVYAGAPKISDLAEQTIAAYSARNPGVPITQLVLDSTYWNPGDNWVDGWPSSARGDGTVSRITALQVDGDRNDPGSRSSPRSNDPVARAGQKFLDALRAADPGGIVDLTVTTSSGAAVSDATVLGEVRSQPVSELVKQMLAGGDATLAESLARVASKRSGSDGSSSSLRGGIPSALQTLGLDTEGMEIADASGLSSATKIPASRMADFMALVYEGDRGLALLSDTLGVAGESGSLSDRFSGDAASARGDVTGSTGSTGSMQALAGVVEADDGALIAFSVSAARDGLDAANARTAIDALVAGFHRCGSNLANY